jgi:hypothetical protein
MNGFEIMHVVRLVPLWLFLGQQIPISQILHLLDRVPHIGREDRLSMVECVITSKVNLPSLDASYLLGLSADTVVEGLAHDAFACSLQILFRCLIHGCPSP